MHYWLVKSEPDAFSWEQQVANGVEPWTGVRNHTAKQNLKAMKQGDRAFFYHSNQGKDVVGDVVDAAQCPVSLTTPFAAAREGERGMLGVLAHSFHPPMRQIRSQCGFDTGSTDSRDSRTRAKSANVGSALIATSVTGFGIGATAFMSTHTQSPDFAVGSG